MGGPGWAILRVQAACPRSPQAPESVLQASDRTMFEIYRESGYGQKYRVVYFTELNEHNKEAEISRAMAGEHLIDGFLKDYGKETAKEIIDRFVAQLNHGDAVDLPRLRAELAPYTP